ncbi:MAG: VOC family protein [Christensenellaceae bacterium]|jgi:lactoylglutathione lyase
MHIKHLALTVKDLGQSIDFYETIAGLKAVRRSKSGPAELAFMTNGDGETEIELIQFPGRDTFEGKGMFICFAANNLDEMHSLAEEKGLKPSPVQEPGDGTRYFYVYDPDGVSVQLRSFPA